MLQLLEVPAVLRVATMELAHDLRFLHLLIPVVQIDEQTFEKEETKEFEFLCFSIVYLWLLSFLDL